MADSPTKNTDGPVGVTVKVDGNPINDATMVVSVQTSRVIGRIPEATVEIETGSIPEQEFPEVDGDDFKLGKGIEIAAYYGANTESTIFSGVIFSKRMRVLASDGARLILNCRDKAQKLNVVAANGQYLAQKDSDIMTKLVSDAELKADIEATKPAARDQMRHNCTDWEFIRALADRNGMLVLVNDGTVKVAAPDLSAAAKLELTLGVDIQEFDAEADTQFLFATSAGAAWDDAAQETVTEDGGTATGSDWGNQAFTELTEVAGSAKHAFASSANYQSDLLTAVSKARLARSALSAMTGRVVFPGNGAIDIGETIELKGVGDGFGGKAYVSGINHDISAGEWQTETLLGLPEGWRSDDATFGGAAASGVTTPVHGLHIGKVTRIIEDPDDRLRIEVKLPVHDSAEILVRARFATPYATADSGVFFMPEVDDEVVVGYLSSDPDNPVVLGALHNGSTAQPYEPDEDNTYKAIVTKNQLKIEFEDVKKIITISTPGGHSITMDDDAIEVTITDTTGNEVKMSDAGIDMTSPGDINISADGNVAISAGQDASLTGGTNVDVTASVQLTAEGSAGAELTSGGQTVVKGSIVMIN